MGEDGRKMSKRFGNVVNPDDIVATYGADTLRLYEMFMGPFDQQIAWSTSSMVGTRRFIEKVWKLRDRVDMRVAEYPSCSKFVHKAVKKVTEDIADMRFNTAISSLMIAVNDIEKALESPEAMIGKVQYEMILKILAPFAPHVTEELWYSLGNKKSIHTAEWPSHDPKQVEDTEATIVVQVNGKVRGSFVSVVNSAKDILEEKAQNIPEVGKWIEGKKIIKIIVIPNRLVNIVVAQ